jgi:hypothetical protein
VFYHLFFKHFPLETCVQSMCVASGDHNFECHLGKKTKSVWQEFVKDNAAQLATAVPAAVGEAQDPAR